MWMKWDDWLARSDLDNTLIVDNGGPDFDVYAWSPPRRTTMDESGYEHAGVRGHRPHAEPQGRTP